MKICLVRPPSIINPLAYIGSLTPPIGLAYLAASLRSAGHQPIIVDAIGENPFQSVKIDEHLVLRGLHFEEIIARIPSDCGLIGFSGMFSSEWVQLRPLVQLISERFPGKMLVCGGEHFTAAPEVSMNDCPGIAAIVVGEGEETLVEIAQSLEVGRGISHIAGLIMRDGDGFRRTAPRGRIRKIDEIPEPAWDLVPLETYLANNLSYGVNRGRSMPMLASRGCPYQCTFCSNPQMWGTRWIARDPRKLVDEIERYRRDYNIDNVDFYDLTAIVKRDWIIAFSKELVERKLDITWQLPSGTRSEAIDFEVAQWMYRSGCRNLNYAPESGSMETLELIKKKIKLKKLMTSLVGAVRAGVNVKLNIIIGFPHESHRHIWATLALLVRCSWNGAHDVSVGVFAPYPGAELYDQLVKAGRIAHDDKYWNKLAYVDITDVESYSNHLSSGWLRFYNWVAFAVFYGTNYLFRPVRAIRTFRNLISHQHESRGEMALAQLLGRFGLLPRKSA